MLLLKNDKNDFCLKFIIYNIELTIFKAFYTKGKQNKTNQKPLLAFMGSNAHWCKAN